MSIKLKELKLIHFIESRAAFELTQRIDPAFGIEDLTGATSGLNDVSGYH